MVETAASGCILCYEHECQNGASCAQPEELYECKVRKSRQMLALQKYQILNTLGGKFKFKSISFQCQLGYEGETCAVDINECQFHQCEHGSCVDGVANYT